MGTSIGMKEDLNGKLSDMRDELSAHIKVYDMAKQQLLEYVEIVEEKLNVEIVFYVQKYFEFVQKWKDVNSTCMNNNIDDNTEEDDDKQNDFNGFHEQNGYDKVPLNGADSDANGAWLSDEWNERQSFK